MINSDIIIIGAGPSGIFAALAVANKDKKVLILEKMPTPARKFLLTGNGYCNICHEGFTEDLLNHYGEPSKKICSDGGSTSLVFTGSNSQTITVVTGASVLSGNFTVNKTNADNTVALSSDLSLNKCRSIFNYYKRCIRYCYLPSHG